MIAAAGARDRDSRPGPDATRRSRTSRNSRRTQRHLRNAMEIRPEEFLSFAEWFGPAIKTFVIAIPVLHGAGHFRLLPDLRGSSWSGGGFLFGGRCHRHGDWQRSAGDVDCAAFWPLTRLTIKEAIRRKVLVGVHHLRDHFSLRRLVPGRQER